MSQLIVTHCQTSDPYLLWLASCEGRKMGGIDARTHYQWLWGELPTTLMNCLSHLGLSACEVIEADTTYMKFKLTFSAEPSSFVNELTALAKKDWLDVTELEFLA
ncbi:hypothetical protein [Pseudogulbenkiania subflava]|uniref:Uncharacterized protein n=1 Tax=Pseudogulbenkiania subflava DSM 22618 TaxID=1123014 RepID=A0A1Y6BQ59_9NEIS|nr:hypothetical protein [Pseudogulbenkiania subflava]SMF22369.1 hypothetical protein SAMN02745746_01970 [Pseudogulbenkiania subflava DSM 22618]